MLRQYLILVGIGSHESQADGLYCLEWRIGLLLFPDEAFAAVVVNPFGKIVQAADVAVEFSVAVAQADEHLQKVVVTGQMATRAQCQGRNVFDQCGAVELSGVDYQLFRVGYLKGVGHVGSAKKLSGKEKLPTLAVAQGFCRRQHPLDGYAVVGLCHGVAVNVIVRRQRQEQCHYNIKYV